VTLEELSGAVAGYQIDASYQTRINAFRGEWEKEVDRIFGIRRSFLSHKVKS
jgi:hypothetical protein